MEDNKATSPTQTGPSGGMPGATHINPDDYIDISNIHDDMTGSSLEIETIKPSQPKPKIPPSQHSDSVSNSGSDDDTVQQQYSVASVIKESEGVKSRFIELLEQCPEPLDAEIMGCLEAMCEYYDDGSQSLMRKYDLVVSRFKEDFVQLKTPICDAIHVSIESLDATLDAALVGYNAASAKRCRELFTSLGVMAAEFKTILDSYVGQAQDFSTTVTHAAITWNRVSSSMSDFAATMDNRVLANSNPGSHKHVRSQSGLTHL